MAIFRWACLFIRGLLSDRARLAAENLALRQQVAVLKHRNPRPKLHRQDRIFWVWLSRLWTEWRSALILVKPETVVRWHREGFRHKGIESGPMDLSTVPTGRELIDAAKALGMDETSRAFHQWVNRPPQVELMMRAWEEHRQETVEKRGRAGQILSLPKIPSSV